MHQMKRCTGIWIRIAHQCDADPQHCSTSYPTLCCPKCKGPCRSKSPKTPATWRGRGGVGWAHLWAKDENPVGLKILWHLHQPLRQHQLVLVRLPQSSLSHLIITSYNKLVKFNKKANKIFWWGVGVESKNVRETWTSGYGNIFERIFFFLSDPIHELRYKNPKSFNVKTSVADPDPGSVAFFDPDPKPIFLWA